MRFLDGRVLPPWVKWIAAGIAVAIIILAIYSYGQQQFGLGEKAKQAEWLQKDNEELTLANNKIHDLEEARRKDELAHVQRFADIDKQHQEELDHVKADKDEAIAALRAGTLRLRDPTGATASKGGGGVTIETTSSTGSSDEKAGCELSVETSEFLIGITSEADEVVDQLNACQAVVESDRQ